MSSRDAQREKLEGSLLTVCVDCKEMVVQVSCIKFRKIIRKFLVVFIIRILFFKGDSRVEDDQEDLSLRIFQYVS